MALRLLKHTRLRVNAFLAEINRLLESDFPYSDSQSALEQLKDLTLETLGELDSFDEKNDPKTVVQSCRNAVNDLYTQLPYLGFILRSTNVRNAFEVFGPFKRLAGSMLEPDVPTESRETKLLLSSEWEYSPFTFHLMRALPSFVFIGLPAPESANPLLLPLTGHELGHALWSKNSVARTFEPKVYRAAVDLVEKDWVAFKDAFPVAPTAPSAEQSPLFIASTWGLAVDWCLNQAKETFCDFTGLRIFGPSYLKAFAYFLSPGFGKRQGTYPEEKIRMANLIRAAEKFKIDISSMSLNVFEDVRSFEGSASEKFCLKIADSILDSHIDELIAKSDELVLGCKINMYSDSETNRILLKIKNVVPAEQCKTIADILNATWLASDDSKLWLESPALHRRKDEVLRELALKNLEVFEIEQRLKEV